MKSITAGLKFLYGAHDGTGRWASTFDRRFPGGVDSLVTTTALSLGVKPNAAELAGAIKSAIGQKPTTIYARAMRLMACSRLGSKEFGTLIESDAEFLQARQSTIGGWGYGLGHPTMQRRPKWTDMCNTTFAVLALSDAAGAGAKVKPAVWEKAAVYLAKVQNPDGGWGYEPAGGSGLRLRGNSFGSMTAAGVAALSAVKAKLAPDNANLAKYTESIAKGRKWLAGNYDLAKIPKWGWGEVSYWPYFYLYMLSRVAVESGSAQIGSHAWQGELLDNLVARQGVDGAWRIGDKISSNDVVHTCFALLALSNAQKPVLVNKLIPPGGGATDGSDVAALASWLGRTANRDARWQFVPATASQGVLDAAAVLYIAPPADMTISDSLAAKIRGHALRGGMVLVAVPDGDIGKIKGKFLSIFEQYYHHATALPAGHPAFSVRYKITDPGSLKVTSIGDYCRSRVFLVSGGLGEAWRKGASGGSPAGFQLVANLAVWSGIGFGSNAPRLPARIPRMLSASKSRTVTIARVKHTGDWYSGPMATRYLHNVLARALSLGVRQTVVELDDPIASPAPQLLWMTGTKLPKLSLVQREILGGYLKKGGMIFVDSAMGEPLPARQITTILRGTVGDTAPGTVTLANPLITGKFAGGVGSNLTKAVVRDGDKNTPLADMLSVVRYQGRVVAIVSRCAVTVPLDGGYTYGCVAPSTTDARRLAANVVLLAATQR
ncbi:MAG: DUF4159 domain-containing protein [Phycisphaerae bacterium]|jgi:hypothetical protein|nr:DUF4159 domain-containing protein [Phycisphaerae bacterium]